MWLHRDLWEIGEGEGGRREGGREEGRVGPRRQRCIAVPDSSGFAASSATTVASPTLPPLQGGQQTTINNNIIHKIAQIMLSRTNNIITTTLPVPYITVSRTGKHCGCQMRTLYLVRSTGVASPDETLVVSQTTREESFRALSIPTASWQPTAKPQK